MQSDPPSLSQSLSASTELARLRSAPRRTPSSSSTSASPLTSTTSPPPSRLVTARDATHGRASSHTKQTLSNLSLSLGGGTASGSSDDENTFTDADVDLGADTAHDVASQSDSGMPSLSLRATVTPSAGILPLTPLALAADVANAEKLSSELLALWGATEKDLKSELSIAHAALHSELEGTIASCALEFSSDSFGLTHLPALDLASIPSLNSLENALGSSEAELRGASDVIGQHASILRALVEELRSMQLQTRQDARKRDHRREVEVPLSSFVDDIHVPPNVERALREDKVDSAYVAYVQVFLDKLASLAKHTDLTGGALDETRAQTTALLTFVCARAHRWLVKRLGVACENVTQWHQRQAALLKYKVLLSLLREHDKARYDDVIHRYVASASSLFTQHYNSILALVGSCKDFSSSNDLLGTSDYSIFSFFGAKYSSQRPNLYSIETRQKTLHQLDFALELPEPGKSLPEGASFEFWFRGAHFEFVTLLLKEYRFCTELFQSDLSPRIFSVCAGLFLNTIQSFASNSFDVLSLVVLTIVVSKHREMMLLRLPPASFSQYFSDALGSLKSRSIALFDQHIGSLNSADANSLKDVDARAPHYVTRRFAELYSSLLVLRRTYRAELEFLGLDDPLVRLRTAGIQLMGRLSDSLSSKTLRAIFLVNNLDMIVAVLSVPFYLLPLDSPEVPQRLFFVQNRGHESGAFKMISEKLDESIKNVVSTYLQLKFPEVLALGKSVGQPPPQSSAEISRLIDSIAKWKASAEQILGELQGTLANVDLGMKILLQILDSVTSIYSTIHDDIMARKNHDITQMQGYVPQNELRYAVRRYVESISSK